MSDANEDENGVLQDGKGSPPARKWKIKPTKAQLYMISAGTLIVIAVSVILYNMPAKKEPVGHRSQHKSVEGGQQEPYKKELHKIMTAARQSAVKPPKAEHDGHFGNSTSAKMGHVPKPYVDSAAEMKPFSPLDSIAMKKRRVLSPYLLKKLNPRPLAREKHLTAPLNVAMPVPQKPLGSHSPEMSNSETFSGVQKRTAENIKLFMSKGWAPYYSHGRDQLLYRAPDDGGSESRKMINTAWFLGDSNIVLFANALNCPEKSIDTFAYMELDAQTLKTTKSGARDSAEKGNQLKDIQEPSDLALHDKVCR